MGRFALSQLTRTVASFSASEVVLGLYYITKIRPGAKGAGLKFYGPEEAIIAFNEKRVDVHAPVHVVVDDLMEDGTLGKRMVETSVGRVIANEIIPKEVGYFNDVISKKTLRGIITDVIKTVGVARACEFLDGIKDLGYRLAYEGGLSFNLGDIIIPEEKEELIRKGNEEIERIASEYGMGFITDKERYNQVIDTWTHVNNDLSAILMKTMKEADQGFIFMTPSAMPPASTAQAALTRPFWHSAWNCSQAAFSAS